MDLNATLDALPRATLGRYTRPVPAFRTCGIVGFYGAVLTLMAVGLVTGRSLVVLAGLATIAGLSFFAWAFIRRAITGYESLVLLEHVWFAEACVAGWLWLLHVPLLPYLDAMAVALCIFLAAGRVGCLLVGCCHGRPSAFGIRYGEELVAHGFDRDLVDVRLLPVPAFEAAGLLAIGLVSALAVPWTEPGSVFTWFLVAYATLRFGLEGLRGDRRREFLALSVNRWMCLGELSVAMGLSAHASGGFGLRELTIAGGLAALAAVALVGRRRLDPRRTVLGSRHRTELTRTGRRVLDRATGAEPARETTGRGTTLSGSVDEPGLPLVHAAVSHSGPRVDLALLTELAAIAWPAAVAETAQFGDDGLLHVLTPDLVHDGPTPDGLARAMYGHAVRAAQSDLEAVLVVEEQEAPEVDTARIAYFDPLR